MRRYFCSLYYALTANSVQTVLYEKFSIFQFRKQTIRMTHYIRRKVLALALRYLVQ